MRVRSALVALGFAIAAAATAIAPASAQSVTLQAPYVTCSITTNTVTVCSGDPAGFTRVRNVLAVFNDSATAQTATVTCYNNASAASGTVVLAIGTTTANQVITFPSPGKPVTLGLTCQASAAPGGSGIDIYVR